MEQTKIEIRNLSKTYGSARALDSVSLTIDTGMFGLLGPNGAGKTTLMKLLAAIQKPNTGEAVVCGVSIRKERQIRPLIGYLPQEFSMYPNMTAYQALDYLAALSGLSARARRKKVPEVLERVNLEERSATRLKDMSGGMKRRLGIAQAIIHEPRVIIVDEPTAGLDPEERVRFRNLLGELAQERIVLLSTHIVGDIEAACDQLAVLCHGRIIYRGTVTQMLREMEGKVFSIRVPRTELDKIKKEQLVTGIRTVEGISTVRIVSKQRPYAEAEPVPAGVEDAYLLLMQTKGREVQ